MVQKRNGKILHIASTAAFQPGPLMSVYFATKHYVLAFSEGITEEWETYGVTVTALCPGPTESGFSHVARTSDHTVFSQNLPTSREVAEYGYQSLMSGKRVVVYGWKNYFTTLLIKWIPRKIVTKVTKNILQKK